MKFYVDNIITAGIALICNAIASVYIINFLIGRSRNVPDGSQNEFGVLVFFFIAFLIILFVVNLFLIFQGQYTASILVSIFAIPFVLFVLIWSQIGFVDNDQTSDKYKKKSNTNTEEGFR